MVMSSTAEREVLLCSSVEVPGVRGFNDSKISMLQTNPAANMGFGTYKEMLYLLEDVSMNCGQGHVERTDALSDEVPSHSLYIFRIGICIFEVREMKPYTSVRLKLDECRREQFALEINEVFRHLSLKKT